MSLDYITMVWHHNIGDINVYPDSAHKADTVEAVVWLLIYENSALTEIVMFLPVLIIITIILMYSCALNP